jgi:hypothetical protein
MGNYDAYLTKKHTDEMKDFLKNIVPKSVDGYEGPRDMKVYHQVGYLKEGYKSAMSMLEMIEKDIDRLNITIARLNETIADPK